MFTKSVPAATRSGITAIAAGSFHTLVLKADGGVGGLGRWRFRKDERTACGVERCHGDRGGTGTFRGRKRRQSFRMGRGRLPLRPDQRARRGAERRADVALKFATLRRVKNPPVVIGRVLQRAFALPRAEIQLAGLVVDGDQVASERIGFSLGVGPIGLAEQIINVLVGGIGDGAGDDGRLGNRCDSDADCDNDALGAFVCRREQRMIAAREKMSNGSGGAELLLTGTEATLTPTLNQRRE